MGQHGVEPKPLGAQEQEHHARGGVAPRSPCPWGTVPASQAPRTGIGPRPRPPGPQNRCLGGRVLLALLSGARAAQGLRRPQRRLVGSEDGAHQGTRRRRDPAGRGTGMDDRTRLGARSPGRSRQRSNASALVPVSATVKIPVQLFVLGDQASAPRREPGPAHLGRDLEIRR